MTPHPAALEAYNRASFDPQTPELELAPAETMQVEVVHPMTGAFPLRWGIPFAASFGFLLIIVGANAI